MGHHLKHTNAAVSARVHSLRREMGREFGTASRLAGWLLGPFLLWTTLHEERRLALGVTYEPEPILERRNWPPAEVPSAVDRIPRGGRIPAPVPETR